MIRVAAVVFLFTLCTELHAIKRYYSLSRSVRAHGMGGAFYGLSDDEYALFYNPAGLGVYRGGGQFFLSTRAAVTVDTISGTSAFSDSLGSELTTTERVNKLLSFQGRPLGGNVSFMPSFLSKHFALGLLLPDAKVDVSLLGDGLDTSVDIAAVLDAGLLMSFARSFVDNSLSVGVTPKLLARAGGTKMISALEIAQDSSLALDIDNIGGYGLGLDFDLGVTYRLQGLPFGALNRVSVIISNVLASTFPVATSRKTDADLGVPGLTRMVSLGWYTVFEGTGVIDNYHCVVDLAEFGIGGESDNDRGGRGGSFWKHLNLGVEAPIRGWFIPRMGVHQGNITAGFGLRLRALQLDYAWFGEELMSGVGRYTARAHEVRLALGFGAPAPAPIARARLDAAPVDSPKIPVDNGSAKQPVTDELPAGEAPVQTPSANERTPQSQTQRGKRR